MKFALATLPEYKRMVAILLKVAVRVRRVPADRQLLRRVPDACSRRSPASTDLKAAGIDLVVKTHDLIRPDASDPEPYEEFVQFFDGTPIHFDLEHHLCHAYQAYLCSPFDDAAVSPSTVGARSLERLGGRALSMTLGRRSRATASR